MTFPLYMKDAFGYPAAMAIAVLIGFLFGFVLERAGFGRARNLAAQFYGTDMRVLKVMFSAIVTATVGLGLLGALGAVDLAAISVPETFLWPQVVGGFVLGMGFILSGYCPGTAVVATASGNMDGVFALLGVALGSIGFGFAYPWLEGFYLSSAMGSVTLHELLGVPWAVVAFGVALMAVGAFWFAEWVERALARRRGGTPPASAAPVRRGVFTGFAGAGALGLALALLLPTTAPSSAAPVVAGLSPVQLAQDLLRADRSHYLVDLRPRADCEAKRIPGALCVPTGDPEARFLADLPPTRRLVVYDADGTRPLPRAVASFGGVTRRLEGGYAAFADQVLSEPALPEAPTAEDVRRHRLRIALHAHFTGEKVEAAPVELKVKAIRRTVKKGGGC